MLPFDANSDRIQRARILAGHDLYLRSRLDRLGKILQFAVELHRHLAYVSGDDPWFAGDELYPDISTVVDGFVGFYHPYDGSMENAAQYYGGPEESQVDTVLERWAKADAIARAADVEGPALLVSGTEDWEVIDAQMQAFCDAIVAAGQDCEQIFIEGGGHGFDQGTATRLSRLGEQAASDVLRWLNEAGVFGRFIPDFARVNAQMQFDMYHHYTVDEHTIRAIGLLARIEKGEMKGDHPLAHEIVHKVRSRRALYVAVLLHDIAKGRGGDHSVLGAEIALKLCPRLGLDQEETELVSWLVRSHLTMSATAFKRDLADWKTISDFVEIVQSIDRLRQLTVLTIVDIRAVGPGTWNSWKRQLLQELYDAAEERLRLGHVQHGRVQRIAAKKQAVLERLGSKKALVEKVGEQLNDAYWIAESDDVIALNLVQFEAAQDLSDALSIHCEYYPARGATLVTVIATDHPGLFYRIAGGIHLAGGNIIDARIHTTKNGMAVDNFLVQDPLGRPFMETDQLARLKTAIADALANRVKLVPQLAAKPHARPRTEAFTVRPRVIFDNDASSRFTVVEVNALDRPALLNRLARTLFESRLMVHSAHITTYGERAADTFYVTDLVGHKITDPARQKRISKRIVTALLKPPARKERTRKLAAE